MHNNEKKICDVLGIYVFSNEIVKINLVYQEVLGFILKSIANCRTTEIDEYNNMEKEINDKLI